MQSDIFGPVVEKLSFHRVVRHPPPEEGSPQQGETAEDEKQETPGRDGRVRMANSIRNDPREDLGMRISNWDGCTVEEFGAVDRLTEEKPEYHIATRTGCSFVLYHITEITTQQGTIGASRAPIMALRTINPAAFLHAAMSSVVLAHPIVETDITLPTGRRWMSQFDGNSETKYPKKNIEPTWKRIPSVSKSVLVSKMTNLPQL